MTGKNRVRRSHLCAAKVRQLVRLFAMDLEVTKVATLTGLNRNTVNRYFHQVRQRLARACEAASPLKGTVEVDEAYFGPRRVRGRPGRGAGGKTIVFGIFKRNGHVYTQIVPDARKRTLPAVIRGRVALESVVHSDGWPGYDGLVDLGYQKHLRVEHRDWVFVRGDDGAHINGIESFWSSAKARLARRRGIRASHFYWHLKECEFRFNHRRRKVYQELLNLLRNQPLKLVMSLKELGI